MSKILIIVYKILDWIHDILDPFFDDRNKRI
jgi:hypothetical protein